jgi:hypothetical protein
MEPESSLLHLQVPATCPYPEREQSSPCPRPTSFRSILILSSHLRLGLPSGTPVLTIPILNLYLLIPKTVYTDKFSNPETPIRQKHLTLASLLVSCFLASMTELQLCMFPSTEPHLV